MSKHKAQLPDISEPSKAKIMPVQDEQSGEVVDHISPDDAREIMKRKYSGDDDQERARAGGRRK